MKANPAILAAALFGALVSPATITRATASRVEGRETFTSLLKGNVNAALASGERTASCARLSGANPFR